MRFCGEPVVEGGGRPVDPVKLYTRWPECLEKMTDVPGSSGWKKVNLMDLLWPLVSGWTRSERISDLHDGLTRL